jgi:hypothetical protein
MNLSVPEIPILFFYPYLFSHKLACQVKILDKMYLSFTKTRNIIIDDILIQI